MPGLAYFPVTLKLEKIRTHPPQCNLLVILSSQGTLGLVVVRGGIANEDLSTSH